MENLIESFQQEIESLDIKSEGLQNDLEDILKQKMRLKEPGHQLVKFMEKWEDDLIQHDESLESIYIGPWKNLKNIERIILSEERSY